MVQAVSQELQIPPLDRLLNRQNEGLDAPVTLRPVFNTLLEVADLLEKRLD